MEPEGGLNQVTCEPAPPKKRTIVPGEEPVDSKARRAWRKLVEIGCPVLSHTLGWGSGAHFSISAECDFDETHGGIVWADYYNDPLREYRNDEGKIINAFGIDQRIHDILDEHELFAEWQNAGVLSIYDS